MSTRINGLFFILILLCIPYGVKAQSTDEVLTLEQAIAIATRENQQVKVAQLEVERAEEKLAAFRTRRLPAFNLYTLVSQQLTDLDFTFTKGIFGTYPGIGPVPGNDVPIRTPLKPTAIIVGQLQQPLSQQYSISLNIRQLKLSRETAQEKLRMEQQSVANNVKRAYYGIMQTQSALQSLVEAINLYHELDRVTDNFLVQQVALKSDSLEVKSRLAKAEYEQMNLANTLETQKEQLNNLLGREISTQFRVSEVPQTTEMETDLVAARRRALEERPEIRDARLKVKQAEMDKRIKKAEYIPDVSISFSYLSPRNFNDIVPKNFTNVGIVLNWEIFDWGRRKHELAEKGKVVNQAENGLRNTENIVLIDVGDKFRKLQQTRQYLQVVRLGQEIARENLRVNKVKYELQAVLLSDLLQTQASLAEANHQYQQALLSFWTARADFEKAIGEDK